jgi:diguanylate cyclase (GGDEF)-like protein/PAS domain S-box-containing protein
MKPNELRALLEHSPDPLVIVATDGTIRSLNRLACELVGYTEGELTGKSIEVLVPPAYRRRHAQQRRAYAADPTHRAMGKRGELVLLHRSGEAIPVDMSLAPLKIASETHVCCGIRDIRKRKRAESRAREAELQTLQIFETAADGLLLLSSEGAVLRGNRAAAAFLGIGESDLVGAPFGVPITRPDAPAEIEIARLDGSRGYAELRCTQAQHGGRPVFAVSLRDVSERRRAERDLGEREAQLSLVVDNVPGMIAYLDAEWRFKYANLRYRVFYGGSEDAVVGKRMQDVLTLQTWQEVRERVAHALAGETVSYMGERLLHDGSRRYVSVSLVPHHGEKGVAGIYILAIDVTAQHVAEEALRESEAGLRHAQALSGLGYVVVGMDGRYERRSESLPRIHGLEADKLPNTTRDLLPMIHAADRERFLQKVRHAARSPGRDVVEYRLLRGDGATAHILQTMEPLGAPDAAGRVRWFVTIQDISEQKRAEERIRRLNRVYAVLSEINSAIVRIRNREELFAECCRIAVEAGGFVMAWIGDIDCDGGVIRPLAWAGDRARSFLDAAPLAVRQTKPGGHGLAGRAVREGQPVVSNDVENDSQRMMRAELAARGIRSLAVLPVMLGKKAVGVIALHAAETGLFDAEEMRLLGQLAGDIGFALDHMEKEERVHHLAYYDALTGLPNRSLLHEQLAEEICGARARGERLALAIINIDRFKIANDTLGRQAGDELLREIARRLSAVVCDAGRPARIGADEFAIILRNSGTRERLTQRLQEGAMRITSDPFKIGGRELRVAFRSGVATFPADGDDAEALFFKAEIALRKARSGDDFVFYERAMSEQVVHKLDLENRLRLAIQRGEFVLYYQPKLDLATRRITGAEALIRWQNAELGLVPPGRFIPMLEETGLIKPVGAWALAQAVADQQRWRRLGRVPPRIAVNVSAVELRSAEFVPSVRKALALGSAPAIDLEITETLLMEDVDSSVETLKQLRDSGVGVAIDDFGTGYSSLGYLSRLPVQALKIDRSFIITMLANQDVMTLVSTMVSLAHALRLTVVAEGVDSEDQAKALYLLRCDEVQGYLFGKPMPFDELSALLESQQLDPSDLAP